MKNINKVLLSLSLVALTSGSVLASNDTYQAVVEAFSEPTFAETTPLNFGKMNVITGSVCTMDNAGAVTGDCDAANASLALGVVTVSGLEKTTSYDITVTGSTGTNITFAAASDASDGSTNLTTADGVAGSFTTDATATDIAVNIYGALTVDTTLTAGSTHNLDYTVDVSFN